MSPTWKAVLDEHTCDWCRSRHGKAAVRPSPSFRCGNPDGCRCVQAEESPAPAGPQHVVVQTAGVPVVYTATWANDTRAFLHTTLAAPPLEGALVEMPGLDFAIRPRRVIVRRHAVSVEVHVDLALTAADRELLRAAGWMFA